jgi:hypothetical protein
MYMHKNKSLGNYTDLLRFLMTLKIKQMCIAAFLNVRISVVILVAILF